MRVVDFLRSQSGAVTADWVVLTSGIVGLALATASVVAGGTEDLTGETQDQLARATIRTSFFTGVRGDNFENGAGAWVGGAVEYSDAYGNVLRGGGTNGLQAMRAEYQLDPDMAFAVLDFDFHAIDSWDNESFTIFANDVPVASARFQLNTDGATGTWVTDNPDIQFSMQATTSRADVGHSSQWTDQSYRMQVTVAHPGDNISFGFGSTLDQSISDESWAVDNITVTSTNTP